MIIYMFIVLSHHRYSTDGGFTWRSFTFSATAILARDVVTQPGEKLTVVLIYGTSLGSNRAQAWTVFYIDMMAVLGELKFC